MFESSSSLSVKTSPALIKDIDHLCRFAANLVEAHTAVVFIPSAVTHSGYSHDGSNHIMLEPVAAQTLNPQKISLKSLSVDHGLIGWVAKNKKPIHVSPFERDSRILGIYSEDLQLKSCMGVPILIGNQETSLQTIAGVLLVDSKKAFAFSKIQGKHLEDVAQQAASVIALHSQQEQSRNQSKSNWEEFHQAAIKFSQHSGIENIAALRIRTSNVARLEFEMGLTATQKLYDQFLRLVGQSLSPKSPFYQTPTGELLAIIDSIMVDSYTNKILAISEHPSLRSQNGQAFEVEFRARSFARGEKRGTIESLINLTNFYSPSAAVQTTTVETETSAVEEPRRRIFSFR